MESLWPKEELPDFFQLESYNMIFLQLNPYNYKTLTLKTNSWLLKFYTSMMHLKLCKSNKVCPALKASYILYVQCRNIIFPTKPV